MFCSQRGNNSFPRWELGYVASLVEELSGTLLITDTRLLSVKTMGLFHNKRLRIMNNSIFSKMPHPSRQGLETLLNKGFFKISSLPSSLPYLSRHLYLTKCRHFVSTHQKREAISLPPTSRSVRHFVSTRRVQFPPSNKRTRC